MRETTGFLGAPLGGRIISLAIVILSLFCNAAKADKNAWGVLINGLPSNALVGADMTIGSFYIIKQVQEPIFRKDDGQNFSSKILKKWGRNPASSEYIFCPDDSLKFPTGIHFTSDFLLSHLSEINKGYSHESKLAKENDCVVVRFRQSCKGYFDFLTHYETSPKIKISSTVEEGLGEFRVAKISTTSITLERKVHTSDGYNKIILFSFKGPDDSRLGSKDVDDYNLIPEEYIPEKVKKDFIHFGSLDMKVQYLLINVQDPVERDYIYNCLDIDKFRKAFFPTAHGMSDISTLFPVGIPGGEPGRPLQHCVTNKKITHGPFILANYRTDNLKQLQNFTKTLYSTTGIRLKVVNHAPKDLVSGFYKKPKAYNLVSIYVGALNTSHYTFLSSFLRGNNIYLDVNLSGPQQVYNKMLSEDDAEIKTQLAITSARELMKSHAILPLFQQYRNTYYPSEITNLIVGKEFMPFPEVGDFRW